MMQPELLLSPYPTFDFTSSTFVNHSTTYDQEMDFCGIDGFDFSSSFRSPEDSSEFSSKSSLPNMFLDEFLDLENLSDDIRMCSAIEDICEWINEDETQENSSSPLTVEGDEWSPCLSQESNHDSVLLPIPITDMSLIFPGDEMEVDDHLSLLHLLRAYGEAVENGEKKLSEVIVKSINEKTSPQGSTMERLAYNLFQSGGNQGEFLRDESMKNIEVAFNVLYQGLPNGRFAHFTANSAIIESMPKDAATILLVDFDMGEGIQWPPLIEALSKGRKKPMKIISIKLEEESTSSCWNFDDTRKRLLAHARQFGVKLQIEERSIEDFSSEMMVKRSGEWVVYNCMVGLPHMGRRRSRRSVNEFVKVSKEMVANYGGILSIGDGEETGENLNNNFAAYFANVLRYYQGVFESLEGNFPVYLAEARTAMERLFLAPLMCPVAWFQDWEETRKNGLFREESSSVEGRKMSRENMAEAKLMVNERENLYTVKIEKMREHEMVLHWKETPLVRVSTWM